MRVRLRRSILESIRRHLRSRRRTIQRRARLRTKLRSLRHKRQRSRRGRWEHGRISACHECTRRGYCGASRSSRLRQMLAKRGRRSTGNWTGDRLGGSVVRIGLPRLAACAVGWLLVRQLFQAGRVQWSRALAFRFVDAAICRLCNAILLLARLGSRAYARAWAERCSC